MSCATKGHIDRACLGIKPLDVPEDVRKKYGLGMGEGVFVGDVDADTPAARSGVRRAMSFSNGTIMWRPIQRC